MHPAYALADCTKDKHLGSAPFSQRLASVADGRARSEPRSPLFDRHKVLDTTFRTRSFVFTPISAQRSAGTALGSSMLVPASLERCPVLVKVIAMRRKSKVDARRNCPKITASLDEQQKGCSILFIPNYRCIFDFIFIGLCEHYPPFCSLSLLFFIGLTMWRDSPVLPVPYCRLVQYFLMPSPSLESGRTPHFITAQFLVGSSFPSKSHDCILLWSVGFAFSTSPVCSSLIIASCLQAMSFDMHDSRTMTFCFFDR